MIRRIQKPWGFEDRLILDDSMAVTHLRIGPMQSTSMHCHPTKNTSMFCLKGKGNLNFLNTSDEIHPNVGFNLRRKLFHSISNSSTYESLELLEFESPADSKSLVRLEDTNGRLHSIYEASTIAPEENFLKFLLHSVDDTHFEYANAHFSVYLSSSIDLDIDDSISSFVILRGSMVDLLSGNVVLQAPEFIKQSALFKLSKRFNFTFGTILLRMWPTK
jgi:mannose-6-phosphate isomerase-like protein (cupin superfamily)